MANVLFNPIMEQIRGKIGELVFRRFENRIIIARKADLSGHVPTAGQVEVRERFRGAAKYANNVMADPARRALYEPVAAKRGDPLRMVIMTDYLNPPEVDAISVADYHGSIGDPVVVQATDDIAVTGVTITIRDAADAVIEQGAATLADGQWTYRATVAVPVGQEVMVIATATDRAEQVATKILPLVVE
jgi:hypothetical protein